MVAAVAHYNYELPDTPYNLWVRGELADHLHLPDDGTRVEVVGGEIVVSPGPRGAHNAIVLDLERCVFRAEMSDPAFPWRPMHTMDLNLAPVRDGYIPDLVLVDAQTLKEVRGTDAPHLVPEQVGLAVEVTSRWGAAADRRPTLRTTNDTKWQGYARVGIDHYMLIDRDPRAAQTTLYTNPDSSSGTYLHSMSWEFGETIRLPEPFGFEIPTDAWEPWA